MATHAPPTLTAIYPPLEREFRMHPSDIRGGIVGDLAHKKRGGFHISREDQPDGNYSVRGFNRDGRDDWSAAIDITLPESRIIQVSRRLRQAVDRKDPRVMAVLFEWFGTLDGEVVTGDLLYDTSSRAAGRTSSDPSHLWHIHCSFRRDRVGDAKLMRDFVDVLLGIPIDNREEDMPLTEADIKALLNTAVIPNPDPEYVKDQPLVSLSQLARSTFKVTGRALDVATAARDRANLLWEQVDGVEEGVSAARRELDARADAQDGAVKALHAAVAPQLAAILASLAALDRGERPAPAPAPIPGSVTE